MPPLSQEPLRVTTIFGALGTPSAEVDPLCMRRGIALAKGSVKHRPALSLERPPNLRAPVPRDPSRGLRRARRAPERRSRPPRPGKAFKAAKGQLRLSARYLSLRTEASVPARHPRSNRAGSRSRARSSNSSPSPSGSFGSSAASVQANMKFPRASVLLNWLYARPEPSRTYFPQPRLILRPGQDPTDQHQSSAARDRDLLGTGDDAALRLESGDASRVCSGELAFVWSRLHVAAYLPMCLERGPKPRPRSQG
jgi:hypothetical protein